MQAVLIIVVVLGAVAMTALATNTALTAIASAVLAQLVVDALQSSRGPKMRP